MKTTLSPRAAVFAVLAASVLLVGVPTRGRTAEEAPSAVDVEDARRCAAETRVAGHAFGEVRDSVRVGETSRAESLLTVAEDALLNARSACRGNAEISAQLELLAGESEGLRRSLGTARR